MGHTATNVLVHFIFSTQKRVPSITPELESHLHALPDLVHLLVRMPAMHSTADVARLVKANSSRWVLELWPSHKTFTWQIGYGASSVSESGHNEERAYILHPAGTPQEAFFQGGDRGVHEEESHHRG